MYGCVFCNTLADSESAMTEHMVTCAHRTVKCDSCGEYSVPNVRVAIEPGDYRDMQKQVAEMHAVIKGLAETLNNPMLKAMLPPHMRGMLGG